MHSPSYIASGQVMMSLIHIAMCEDTEYKHNYCRHCLKEELVWAIDKQFLVIGM